MQMNLKTASRRFVLLAGVCVATSGLVACGSDKKSDTTNTTGGVTTTTGGDSNTTTTGGTSSTINSDKTGNEPTYGGTVNSVSYTTTAGTSVEVGYIMLSSNANATDTNKTFTLSAYDYDPCIFSWNHGYTVFPSPNFNFGGFYLINETAGADLVAGEYMAGATTGLHIYSSTDSTVNASGAGYSIVDCKAASYATVKSGSITLDGAPSSGATGANYGNGISGTFNLTMSDNSTWSGTFGANKCVGGSGDQPTPPSPDSAACTGLH